MSLSFQNVPAKIMENIVEGNGNDPSKWNQELRDLFDTTIEPELVSSPISGKVDKFLNTDFHYYWAFDRAERHERVEELRFAGWDFATTNDVKMCAESSVVGRKRDKESKDGGEGFSDEIRSGDRRLMKLPMNIWRKNKKAQLIAGFQATAPDAFMKAGALPSRYKTTVMDSAAFDETRRKANRSNSVMAKEKE
jgi:hypothetical protein